MSDDGDAARRIFEVPINDGTESLELDFDDLLQDGADHVEEIADIFTSHHSATRYWTRSAAEYWMRGKRSEAKRLATIGIKALQTQSPVDALPLQCQLAAYYLSDARTAPLLRLATAERDIIEAKQELRDDVISKATQLVNAASNTDPMHSLVVDARAMLTLAQIKPDGDFRLAENSLKNILQSEPGHLPARLAQGRLFLYQKHYRPALKCFQQVLSSAPRFLPDPRVGIGQCFWALGDHSKARQAWERSIHLYGQTGEASYGARLLLGLSWAMTSRDAQLSHEDRIAAVQTSTKWLQGVFREQKTCARAASALASIFLTTRDLVTALKLSERAIQFADTDPVAAEARLVYARTLHARGSLTEAQNEYGNAMRHDKTLLYPILGSGQIDVAQENYIRALNTFETALHRDPQCIEAFANLAVIRTHLSFTSKSSTDVLEQRTKARELYEHMTRLFSASRSRKEVPVRVGEVSRDPELYVDVARLALVGESDLVRAMKGFRESIAAREGAGTAVPAGLWNNLGVLQWRRGELVEAVELIERALTTASQVQEGQESDERLTVFIMYNLGVLYDDRGEKEKAKGIYERLLERHPEHVEAKARLILQAMQVKDFDQSNNLLKEALTSQPANLELRALYTYFLVESQQHKAARDFAISTLKDHDKHDMYALCASGLLLYAQARENKQHSHEASRDRSNKFFRSCEFYEKALMLDSKCTFASHGISIALAEGTLSAGISNDAMGKMKNTRDALTIMTKVRESLNDSSIFVNMGHCHYARDEYERAIEHYTTASKRFHHDKNVQCLLYLARAWYQKASRDQNLVALRQALTYSQSALALQPNDAPISFNVALIQQKGLELLLDLAKERKTLNDIQISIGEAESAQLVFASLAEEKVDGITFDRDMAHQRRRYGESLLKRVPTILESQKAWESTETAKIERAKIEREAERQRLGEAERVRIQELAARNEDLAKKRQEMQEASSTWYVKRDSGDEDAVKVRRKGGKRKPKESKEQDEGGGGSDGGEGGAEPPPAKKKRVKKAAREQRSASSDNPHNNGTRNGNDDDDDDEDAGPVVKKGRKSGKNFKSQEFIDSDDD